MEVAHFGAAMDTLIDEDNVHRNYKVFCHLFTEIYTEKTTSYFNANTL